METTKFSKHEVYDFNSVWCFMFSKFCHAVFLCIEFCGSKDFNKSQTHRFTPVIYIFVSFARRFFAHTKCVDSCSFICVARVLSTKKGQIQRNTHGDSAKEREREYNIGMLDVTSDFSFSNKIPCRWLFLSVALVLQKYVYSCFRFKCIGLIRGAFACKWLQHKELKEFWEC